MLQLGAWNIQGKPATAAIDAFCDFGLDFHVLALQEMGREPAPGMACDNAPPISTLEHRGYVVLRACPEGCFRSIGFVLDADCVTHWCSGSIGHSHVRVSARLPGIAEPVCLVSVHLPHQGRSVDEFIAALSSLQECLKPFVDQQRPLCLLGDLNVDLSNEQGARHTALHAFLHTIGLQHYSLDSRPTWKSKRLDHIVCNTAFVRYFHVFAGQSECCWASVATRDDLRQALSVDHALLLHDIIPNNPAPQARLSRHHRESRRLAFSTRPCRMRVSNWPQLRGNVYGFLDSYSRGDMPDAHRFLATCASQCCTRVRPLRFRDSPALKALCRARSVCSDVSARRRLSLNIHSLRVHEKKEWKRGLVVAAARGDWAARRLLSKRSSCNAEFAARIMVTKHGSRQAAAAHVQEHFHQRLGSCTQVPTAFIGLADSAPDFAHAEIASAVCKLKRGKTTGLSRVSSELLKALLAVPFVLEVLSVNHILHEPDRAHADLAAGWVFLVPKKHAADDASVFRPIV